MEAIESEVKKMEDDVAEIKTILSSPESFPSPREESLKVRCGDVMKETSFSSVVFIGYQLGVIVLCLCFRMKKETSVFLNAFLICAGCGAEDPVYEEDYCRNPEV